MTLTTWAFIIVGVYIFCIGGALIMVAFLRKRSARKRVSRPTYERFNGSLRDWRVACDESYQWSHARRNGTKKKKEVKS